MKKNKYSFLLSSLLLLTFLFSELHAQYGNAVLTVNAPSPIAGDYSGGLAFNPGTYTDFTGISGNLELVNDGSILPTEGCNPLIGFTPGNIAVIDRGGCTFETKINNAISAGAKAVVLVGNTPGNFLLTIADTRQAAGIPFITVTYETGVILKTEIANHPNVTIRRTKFSAEKTAQVIDENNNNEADPGEQIEYTIIIKNNEPNLIYKNIGLIDNPDKNSPLVPGSVTFSKGQDFTTIQLADTAVGILFSEIIPGDSITITFKVKINDPLSSDVYGISNIARLFNNSLGSPTLVYTDDPILPGFSDRTVVFLNSAGINKKIHYIITLPDCNTPSSPLEITSGTIMEGESFIFPPSELPSQYAAYQTFYNALVGTEFGIPEGSLNEDILISINLANICNNGVVSNLDEEGILKLFFLDVYINGSVSGGHNAAQYYYFNDGKEAYIKIPRAGITPLLSTLNYDVDQLIPFFTLYGLNPDFNGIRKVVDQNYITIYTRHFSEVNLGVRETPTDIQSKISTTPNDYKLYQNYPNPFNPTTQISYSIPKASYVTLTIYDVLGNTVSVLENGNKSAGTYSYNFDASKLTSGIYFYTIKAGNFTVTKKMLLMK